MSIIEENKHCAIIYGWDFVWRLWILLLGQPASQSNGEITGNASLIKLHHWNTDARAINGKIIGCHACCGKRNFLPISADIWLARSSKLFFIWNKWIIQPPVSVCAGKQPKCCQWPLSHFLSLSIICLLVLFSFRNIFPFYLNLCVCVRYQSLNFLWVMVLKLSVTTCFCFYFNLRFWLRKLKS